MWTPIIQKVDVLLILLSDISGAAEWENAKMSESVSLDICGGRARLRREQEKDASNLHMETGRKQMSEDEKEEPFM